MNDDVIGRIKDSKNDKKALGLIFPFQFNDLELPDDLCAFKKKQNN